MFIAVGVAFSEFYAKTFENNVQLQKSHSALNFQIYCKNKRKINEKFMSVEKSKSFLRSKKMKTLSKLF
jgi:hypothetical protein